MSDAAPAAGRTASPVGIRRPPVRRQRVHATIDRAIARWRADRPVPHAVRVPRPSARVSGRKSPTLSERLRPGVFAPLPRRRFLEVRAADTTPPKMRVVEFRVSRLRALRRLFVWLAMGLTLQAGMLWDWLRGQSSPARRAARLRRTFERAGGTFIRVGKYLTMRLDLLPWEYGVELSRMLDRVEPFPVAQAIAAIERATGRPLAATFERFDPEPIGSSAVSCVYQAYLRNGRKVVVKVRRPGIGELFTADLKAFDWLAKAVEALTLLRAGRTQNMRSELRDTLLGELDFVQAARQQDAFRRAARKSGRQFFTAPRVYFRLSNDEVITQDLVAGMWLWELVAAVEQGNEAVLTLARRLGIDARQIARRLAWVNYWGWHEQLFFRADPHPDNVIIGKGGKLTFIDFGAVDAINRTKRRALQQNMFYAWKRDALNMARSSLVLLEPLPPIDVADLTRDLESHNWEMLYALEAPPMRKAWSDRTFARQWIGMFQVARAYNITIDFAVLRLLRVNVLYDALVVRLDPDVDVVAEYRRFARYQRRRVEARGERQTLRALSGGVDERMFLELDRWAGFTEGLLFRFRQVLVMPRATFRALMSKWSYAAYTTIVTAAELLALTAVTAAAVAVAAVVAARPMPDAAAVLRDAVARPEYQWLVVALVLLNARKMLLRMEDKEI